jgi:hypothetical protein
MSGITTRARWRTSQLFRADGVRAYEALVLVLLLLPLDVRARAASACRMWRAAAADPALWRELSFVGCDDDREVSDRTLAKLCRRAGAGLRVLTLDGPACWLVTGGGLLRALRDGGCAVLQTLSCGRYADLSKPECTALNCVLAEAEAEQLAAACPALEHAQCRVEWLGGGRAAPRLMGPCVLVSTLYANWQASFAPLLSARSVHTLVLDINAPVAAAFADALRASTTLRALCLSCTGAAGADARPLLDALRTNVALTSLTLTRGAFDGAALRQLLRAETGALSTLRILGGVYNVGGSGLAAALASARLTTVEVSHCRLNYLTIITLAAALQRIPTLTSLTLCHADICDASAVALSRAFAANRTLTRLDVRHNAFGKRGAAALRAACPPSCELLLRNNPHEDSSDSSSSGDSSDEESD